MIWLSVHIFYDDSLDFLLKKGIQPFINKNNKFIFRWFFIRYTEGGQHIRLRLKINKNQEAKIQTAVNDFFNDFFQKINNENNLPKSRLVFIDYKPEIDRYGGKIGIEISEQLFQYSSEFVAEFIDVDSNYENKLMIAALMNYNLGLVFFENKNQLNSFFEKIASNWLNFNIQHLQIPQQQIIKTLKTIKNDTKSMILPLLLEYQYNFKNDIEDDFCDWRKQHFKIKQQLLKSKLTKPISIILESYIHMNNNRLGISNFDESLVSDLLIWTDLDSNN